MMTFNLSRTAVFFILIAAFTSCSTPDNHNKDNNDKELNPLAFDSFQVQDGFELQLVAKEPLIAAPVAIDFDNQGRVWVVEMRGYMPDISGNGEEKPTGRISILSDFDKNGIARKSTTFIDSLVLPRALAHVYGGLLYAEPPNLWYVEITNDKPGKRTLVDSMYAVGGYVEMQPNGLMMNLDNWIYSANSTSRYQMKDGKWIRQPTTFRGQWGISKDNYGRLYYNYNEVQLAGDYVLPNTLINNPYFIPKESENKLLTENQRVYPLHPTTVNRGYAPGILTADSLLNKVTAACGPLVYRGGQFPDEYYQNVFVCEPQANLIKRNILSFDSLRTSAKQAWDNKEFIAARDESFRPVSLVNAPDGSMYIVDMHRGVLEHRAVSTPYYREGILRKKLDTLLTGGRIIRVKSKNKGLDHFPDFQQATDEQLVDMLSSSNGWRRDRAQQLLVQHQSKSSVHKLNAIIRNGRNAVAAIHALHTLDGLNSLTFETLMTAAAADEKMECAHALVLLQEFASKERVPQMENLLKGLSDRKDPFIDLYTAIGIAAWNKLAADTFLPYLKRLSEKYSGNIIFQEAVVSSVGGFEEKFNTMISKSNLSKDLLTQVIANKKANKTNLIFVDRKLPLDERANGMVLFRKTCAGCHGGDGEGIEHVGPPLRESQYVHGSLDRLALILLNGLEGPLHINGKEYQFNGSMPNFGNNFNDKQIADIIHYLRNSYVTTSRKTIEDKRIGELRKKVTGTLTEEKLEKVIK
ncbi:MAG TPA: c-type cytochrome [Flavitalea sp.]|nr:c-type cytochrome [Flavitalea sp.]